MNAQDVGRGPIIAAASAVLLLIFMFFAWFGVDGVTTSVGGTEQEFSFDEAGAAGADLDTSLTAWQAFGFIDILLLIAILGVVALAVARAMGAAIDLPVAPSALIAGLGALAFLLILFRLIFTPEPDLGGIEAFGADIDFDMSRKIGVFLGLLAAAGMAIGGWLAMQEEGTSFGDQRDRFGGGTGTGTAAGTGTEAGASPAAPPQGDRPAEPPPPPAPPPPPPPPPRSQ